MSLFQFSQEEFLTFFAVLIRMSVLFTILPFLGDQMIPPPVKILTALAFTFVVYPVLLKTGQINPADALIWASSSWGIVSTIGSEAVFGLALGFSAKILFDAIHIGSELVGTFMGLTMASQFDPSIGSQAQVISQFQMAVAMLLFLTIDGHHFMLSALADSYRLVAIGQVQVMGAFSEKIISLTSEMIRIGFQIAAPMALSIFCVNIVYAIMAKAMPQMNVLVLSFSVSAMIGFFVLFLSVPEFGATTTWLFSRMKDEMSQVMLALSTR